MLGHVTTAGSWPGEGSRGWVGEWAAVAAWMQGHWEWAALGERADGPRWQGRERS